MYHKKYKGAVKPMEVSLLKCWMPGAAGGLAAELLGQFGQTLVCFTMNIAGPVKNSPLIAGATAWGGGFFGSSWRRQIMRLSILRKSGKNRHEAIFLVAAQALAVKAVTTAIEDASRWDGSLTWTCWKAPDEKLTTAGGEAGGRRCLICGAWLGILSAVQRGSAPGDSGRSPSGGGQPVRRRLAVVATAGGCDPQARAWCSRSPGYG